MLRMSKGAILILLRPEMKSTFHHTLIALAIVDILFLGTLIIDSQVADRNSSALENEFYKIAPPRTLTLT